MTWDEILLRLIEELRRLTILDVLRHRVQPVLLANLLITQVRYVVVAFREIYCQSLSPKQAAVARIVSRGRTNAEAGAELGMKPDAIKKILGRAFPKLRIRSRKDLPTRLAELDARDAVEPRTSDANPPSPERLREAQARAEDLLKKFLEHGSIHPARTGSDRVPASSCRAAERARRAVDGWTYSLNAFAQPDWAQRKQRMWEVACVAACGLPNKTIAEGLRLSPRTVQAYLAQAHQMLGIRSREDLSEKLPAAGVPSPEAGPEKN